MIKTKKQALAAIKACKNIRITNPYSGAFGIPDLSGYFSTTSCREVACARAGSRGLWLKKEVSIKLLLAGANKGELAKQIAKMSRDLAKVEEAFGTKKHNLTVVGVNKYSSVYNTYVKVEMVLSIDNIWLNNPASFSYYLLCVRRAKNLGKFNLPKIKFLELAKQRGGLDKIFYRRAKNNWKYHQQGRDLDYLLQHYVRREKGKYTVRPLRKGPRIRD